MKNAAQNHGFASPGVQNMMGKRMSNSRNRISVPEAYNKIMSKSKKINGMEARIFSKNVASMPARSGQNHVKIVEGPGGDRKGKGGVRITITITTSGARGGVEKRKSSNDDESVHGQKKRRPSNKVEGKIKKMVNRMGVRKGKGSEQ